MEYLFQVKVEGRTQFLSVVCMACLEGATGRAIRCRFCNQQWDGTSLVLGTMYSYDIFAAMPCCTERIKVNQKFSFIHFINYFILFFCYSVTRVTNLYSIHPSA